MHALYGWVRSLIKYGKPCLIVSALHFFYPPEIGSKTHLYRIFISWTSGKMFFRREHSVYSFQGKQKSCKCWYFYL